MLRRLNGSNHHQYLLVFQTIVLLHLLEHVFQVIQVYLLHWPRSQSLGFLGLYYPVLVHSEWLHYLHALFMLIGLAALRPAITSKAQSWWNLSLFLAFLHHLEHFLLLEQAITHHYLWGASSPISLGQAAFPKIGLEIFKQRIELHFFYNIVVTLPMVIALTKHKILNTSKQ